MGKIEVDEDELNATRQQAAEALPWKSEAERLAEALWQVSPGHPLLRSEIWKPLVTKLQERARKGWGFEPASAEVTDAIDPMLRGGYS